MSPTVPPVPSLNFFAKTLDHGDETADSRRDCEKEAGEFSLKRNETKNHGRGYDYLNTPEER